MRKIAAVLVAVALLAGCDDDPQPGVTYQTPPAPQAQESTQAGTPGGSGSQTVVVNGGGGGSGGGVGDFATGMILGHVMSNAMSNNNGGGTHTREVIRERTIVKQAPRQSYYGSTTASKSKPTYSAPKSTPARSYSSSSFKSSKSYSSGRSYSSSSFKSSYSSRRR